MITFILVWISIGVSFFAGAFFCGAIAPNEPIPVSPKERLKTITLDRSEYRRIR